MKIVHLPFHVLLHVVCLVSVSATALYTQNLLAFAFTQRTKMTHNHCRQQRQSSKLKLQKFCSPLYLLVPSRL